MRSYSHSKSTDHLGRYYTNKSVSKILLDCISDFSPSALLDLGAGDGALSAAAAKRWKSIDILTVDIDPLIEKKLCSNINSNGFNGVHSHLLHDALSKNLFKHIENDLGFSPNAAICNPPFLIPKWRDGYSEIIEEAGLTSCLPATSSTDAAIIFIAQNLRIIQRDGILAIIVPDSIISATKYISFRKKLLELYNVKIVIRLPRLSFVGTDALAHILVIQKSPPIDKFITIANLTNSNPTLERIQVDRKTAFDRLDYYYNASRISKQLNSISDYTLELRRGCFNSAEVKESNMKILHTTKISSDMYGKWCSFPIFDDNSIAKYGRKPVFAIEGDIVIARIGRNATTKIIGIKSGKVPISDCLYTLRAKPEFRKKILKSLTSIEGQAWLKSRMHGVAVSQLNKTDILQFPI